LGRLPSLAPTVMQFLAADWDPISPASTTPLEFCRCRRCPAAKTITMSGFVHTKSSISWADES
jgi:hypothetical protein